MQNPEILKHSQSYVKDTLRKYTEKKLTGKQPNPSPKQTEKTKTNQTTKKKQQQ